MEGIQVEKRYNMSKLDRHSGNIIMCVTEGVVGILLLIDPRAFTGGIIILFGVLLVLNGVRGGRPLLADRSRDGSPAKLPYPGPYLYAGRTILYLSMQMVSGRVPRSPCFLRSCDPAVQYQ